MGKQVHARTLSLEIMLFGGRLVCQCEAALILSAKNARMVAMEGNVMRKMIFFSLLLGLVVSACTRSMANTTPLPAPATVTPTLSLDLPAPLPLPSFTPITQPTFAGNTGTYAVILVPEGDTLNIRLGPGRENPIVGEIEPKRSGLMRTGQAANVGDELWFEIHNPSGGVGWVNSEFITEYVPPSSFCIDTHVIMLLRNLETAVNTIDSELFTSLVSPSHGMNVVFIRDGMIANYSPDEASWAFQSTYVVDWGMGAGSGEPVRGTFSEIVLPALQDVFKNLDTSCNEIRLGGATYLVEWPSEYTNINFYSLHNPGNGPSFGSLDWRTWLAGVEYVGGQPFLFSLLHYQWEP